MNGRLAWPGLAWLGLRCLPDCFAWRPFTHMCVSVCECMSLCVCWPHGHRRPAAAAEANYDPHVFKTNTQHREGVKSKSLKRGLSQDKTTTRARQREGRETVGDERRRRRRGGGACMPCVPDKCLATFKCFRRSLLFHRVVSPSALGVYIWQRTCNDA